MQCYSINSAHEIIIVVVVVVPNVARTMYKSDTDEILLQRNVLVFCCFSFLFYFVFLYRYVNVTRQELPRE